MMGLHRKGREDESKPQARFGGLATGDISVTSGKLLVMMAPTQKRSPEKTGCRVKAN
jgi:hypothetical protein